MSWTKSGAMTSPFWIWHNDAMYENVKTGDALWRSYMSDAIHPTKKGYLEWWGPYIEAQLYEMLAD